MQYLTIVSAILAVAIANPTLVPTPVTDTPEVMEAKARHMAAWEEARLRAALMPENPLDILNPYFRYGYNPYAYSYPYTNPYVYSNPWALNGAPVSWNGVPLAWNGVPATWPMGLPLAPQDTPEVMQAKAQHFAAVEAAKAAIAAAA